MKSITADNLIYFFDPKNKSSFKVKPGEIFEVYTLDCYGGQVADESILRKDIDFKKINGSTGPIHIEGARPGDSLCVEILDIRVDDQGIMTSGPGVGILGDHIEEMDTKILKIENGRIKYSEDIYLPLKPMIGVIGVSPEKEKIPCSVPGAHGGNLDTKDIKLGSKVYLPVNVAGANLAIGDLHGIMGDGELNGTGVEVAGSVILRTSLIKDIWIKGPVVETPDKIIFIDTGQTFEEASKACVLRGANYIYKTLKLEKFNDAYRIVGLTSDLGISQVVNGVITTKMEIPRYLLNWKGFMGN